MPRLHRPRRLDDEAPEALGVGVRIGRPRERPVRVREHIDLGQRRGLDQRRLGVGLADVEDEDGLRPAGRGLLHGPPLLPSPTMGQPRPRDQGPRFDKRKGLRDTSETQRRGRTDHARHQGRRKAGQPLGRGEGRRHERAGAPPLPLESPRGRQADHQLRRRQHLGQGDREGPADRRAGRGPLGQGLGRRRRHDEARRLRHALPVEARGAEGALSRARARGRDGGLPAPLHLQPQPARRLDRHAAARLRAARRMSTTCTPTPSSPSPPRRTRGR